MRWQASTKTQAYFIKLYDLEKELGSKTEPSANTSRHSIHSVQRVLGLLSEHVQQELCWVTALATLPALP